MMKTASHCSVPNLCLQKTTMNKASQSNLQVTLLTPRKHHCPVASGKSLLRAAECASRFPLPSCLVFFGSTNSSLFPAGRQVLVGFVRVVKTSSWVSNSIAAVLALSEISTSRTRHASRSSRRYSSGRHQSPDIAVSVLMKQQ